VTELERLMKAKLVSDREQERAWQRLQQRLREPELGRFLARLNRIEQGRERPRVKDRKDILLLLLYVPGRTGKTGEGILGITRILKLLFIAAQELALETLVPKFYSFQPYKLGPFAARVYDDVEILVRAGLVQRELLDQDGFPVIQDDATIDEGFRLNGLGTLYRLTAKGRAFCRRLLESRDKSPIANRQSKIIQGFVILKTRFGSLPLRELLRYVYRRYPEYTTESEILERVLGARGQGTEGTGGK